MEKLYRQKLDWLRSIGGKWSQGSSKPRDPSRYTVEGPFLHTFSAGILSCTVFAPSKKQKWVTHGCQKKIRQKFRIMIFSVGSFFNKLEKYSLTFVCTFKISKSVSYDWNLWVTLFLAPKARFRVWTRFCTVFEFFRCKKGPKLLLIWNSGWRGRGLLQNL